MDPEPDARERRRAASHHVPEDVAKARFFHSSFPQYSITPLARLDGMARYLGLGGLFVKDESFRFGLNAFKCWAAPSPWPGISPRRWGGTSPR